MKQEKINQALEFIKDLTGYDLTAYLSIDNKRKYFNLDFKDHNLVNAMDTLLTRLKSKNGTIKDVQPNGYSRLAIFL